MFLIAKCFLMANHIICKDIIAMEAMAKPIHKVLNMVWSLLQCSVVRLWKATLMKLHVIISYKEGKFFITSCDVEIEMRN